MPLKNSVVGDDKEVEVENLSPIRRSKRLNSNLSTMSKVLNTKCSSETSEELSQSEEIKRRDIIEVAANSATGIAQEQILTSTRVQNNEVSNELVTKRITRSQTNSSAKIIIKECFVLLEETNKNHDVTTEQPKLNLEKINNTALDQEANVNKNTFQGNENDKKHDDTFNIPKIESQKNEELNISTNKTETFEDGKSETYLENVIEKVQMSTTSEDLLSIESGIVDVNEDKSSESKETENRTDSANHKFNTSGETDASYSSEITNRPPMLPDHINGTNHRESIGESEILKNENNLLNSSLEKMSVQENAIDLKIDDLLSRRFSTSDNEDEGNPFIDSMAEEGEEETPSEGSNDITEVGEEINTTESEFSTDQSYENDSFIDDENEHQLLSGEEYDLSFDKPKKKSRIIQLSSGSDDDIVRISKPKREPPKKRKKSRIIKFSDSSNDEDISHEVNTNGEYKEKEPCNSHLEETPTACNDEINVVKYQHNKTEENTERTEISNNKDNDSKNETIKMDINQESVNECEKGSEIVDASSSDQSKLVKENEETLAKIEHNECDKMNDSLTSLAIVNVSIIEKTENRSSIVTGNVKVENTSNKQLSHRINEVIDSLCSDIKNINEITISLSVGNSDVENKVNETKLSQDGSKRKRRRKRKVCRNKLLTENTTKHEEISEPKTKKMKRDEAIKESKDSCINFNKNSLTKRPHLSPIAHSVAVSVKNKKGKHNQTGKMPASSTRIDKLQKENNYIFEKKTVLNNENQESSEKTRGSVFQPIHVKRKRRIKGTKKNVGNLTTTMNIVDEALFDIQKKKPSFLNQGAQIYEQWDIKNVFMKPCNVSGGQINNMEHKTIKHNKGENLDMPKNIIAKDFKNSMLYDSSRIKRIDTKQIIKKRSVSANA